MQKIVCPLNTGSVNNDGWWIQIGEENIALTKSISWIIIDNCYCAIGPQLGNFVNKKCLSFITIENIEPNIGIPL